VLAIGFGAYALWRLAPVFAIAVGRTSRTARCSWHSSPQDCSATGVFCLIQARYREV
jgi:hypothetical protein